MNHLPSRLMYRATVRLTIAAVACSAYAEAMLVAVVTGGALRLIS